MVTLLILECPLDFLKKLDASVDFFKRRCWKNLTVAKACRGYVLEDRIQVCFGIIQKVGQFAYVLGHLVVNLIVGKTVKKF